MLKAVIAEKNFNKLHVFKFKKTQALGLVTRRKYIKGGICY